MTGKRGERSNKVQALTTFNGESVSFCYLSTVGLLQDREQAILIHVPYRCSNPLRPCYSSGTTGSFACDKARGERGSSIRPEGAEFDLSGAKSLQLRGSHFHTATTTLSFSDALARLG